MTASLGFQLDAIISPVVGRSYIGNASTPPISVRVAPLMNGQLDTPITAPGTIPPALVGAGLAFQAIVWDANSGFVAWTNAQAVHF